MLIPENPVALRREYLKAAHAVATPRQPTEEGIAWLFALTEELMRDVCGEPKMALRIVVPQAALENTDK